MAWQYVEAEIGPGSQLKAGEISLLWDNFSPCKQFLWDFPTSTRLFFYVRLLFVFIIMKNIAILLTKSSLVDAY